MGSLEDRLGVDPHDDLYLQAQALQKAGEGFIRDLVDMRLKHDLTQRQVAAKLGVTQATVSDFERSGNDPRMSTIRRYAMAVGADVTYEVVEWQPRRAWDWGKSKVEREFDLRGPDEMTTRVHVRAD